MKAFSYKLAGSTEEASNAGTQSAFIAGGTNLVDLMKIDVMDPKELVDINQLPMRGVTLDNGGLRIGALEKMANVAEQPEIVEHFPVISQALLKSASANFGIWPRLGVTSCNERAAVIFGMSLCRVTSAFPGAAAQLLLGRIGCTRSWESGTLVVPRIQATWRSHWSRSMPASIFRVRKELDR